MKKILITILIGIAIIVTLILILKSKSNIINQDNFNNVIEDGSYKKEGIINVIKEENNTSEETGFKIATIKYSFGGDETDSGSIVRYDLYVNNEGTYNYIKKSYIITIAGENELDNTKGKINSKKELLKINNDMIKLIKNGENSTPKYLTITYYYFENES